MHVVALDLSLTSTGVCSSQAPDAPFRIRPPKEMRGVERLYWILAEIIKATDGADLVVIEGYSYSSRHSHAHALGELGGVIKLAFHTRGMPFVVLSPSTRMKLATGKGNARKEAVLAAAIRRLRYGGSSDDEADAMWLLQAALQHYECLPSWTVELPKKHLEALESVEWPELVAA